MAAIDGIVNATRAASSTNYQTSQVNSVEAVNESAAQGNSTDVAAQVATVKSKDDSNNQDNTGKGDDTKKEPTNEQIKKAVEDLNKKMKNTSCEFGIHDATNRVTIKIVDKDSKKVIKEYPPEETLDMIAKAWELAGLMVDKRL